MPKYCQRQYKEPKEKKTTISTIYTQGILWSRPGRPFPSLLASSFNVFRSLGQAKSQSFVSLICLPRWMQGLLSLLTWTAWWPLLPQDVWHDFYGSDEEFLYYSIQNDINVSIAVVARKRSFEVRISQSLCDSGLLRSLVISLHIP